MEEMKEHAQSNLSAHNTNLININAYEELITEVDSGLNEDAKSESGQILQTVLSNTLPLLNRFLAGSVEKL